MFVEIFRRGIWILALAILGLWLMICGLYAIPDNFGQVFCHFMVLFVFIRKGLNTTSYIAQMYLAYSLGDNPGMGNP
jgi:hypothetical protein